MRKTNLWFTLLFVVAIAGCVCKKYETKVDNIVRVFWHEYGRYSFAVQENGSNEINMKTLDCQGYCDYDAGRQVSCSVKIIADVPVGEKMWAYAKGCSSEEGDYSRGLFYLEIHIHTVKDLEGASWNHGKFGTGNTEVVE